MSDPSGQRPHRVGQLVQQELANLLTTEVKDPRVGYVTVTEVRLAGDLKSARVFVSVYGDPDTRQASLDGLRAASGFLQRQLGSRLRLRYTPQLSFELDTSLERAMRIDALLNAASSGETGPPESPEAPTMPVETPRRSRADHARRLERDPKPGRPTKRRHKRRRRS